jgi:hypothetical protein
MYQCNVTPIIFSDVWTVSNTSMSCYTDVSSPKYKPTSRHICSREWTVPNTSMSCYTDVSSPEYKPTSRHICSREWTVSSTSMSCYTDVSSPEYKPTSRHICSREWTVSNTSMSCYTDVSSPEYNQHPGTYVPENGQCPTHQCHVTLMFLLRSITNIPAHMFQRVESVQSIGIK